VPLFEIDAALDQDTLARRCREATDDRDGVEMTSAQGQAITSRTSAL
jgi:hypothetical protein